MFELYDRISNVVSAFLVLVMFGMNDMWCFIIYLIGKTILLINKKTKI